jgi:putative PEP-CTERM system TPR-repeat lipoprotein
LKQLTYILSATLLLLAISACTPGKTTEEFLQSGQSYVDKKEWNSAIIEFKNAVKSDDKNGQARALLGKAYLEILSTKPAIKELSKAIEFGYDKNEILSSLGLAYSYDGENQKILDEIIPQESQPNSVQGSIYALRAGAYLRLKKSEQAIVALEKAKRLDGEGTQVRLAWATYENFNGDLDAQTLWLQPLLERDGGIAEAWSQMGEIEQRKNNIDAAEIAYTRAIELRKIIHVDYVRRAMIRISQENLKGAETDIDTLVKAGANWPIVAHMQGVINYQNQKYTEAQAHFLNVISRAPEYLPSKLMLGLTYYNLKSYENTVIYLEQYLPSNPTDARANLVYATALMRMNNVDEAINVLTKLNESRPDDFRVLSLLSNGYMQQGNQVKSIEMLNRAVYVKPDQASTRLQLGAALMREPNTVSLGQNELKKALELDPELEKAELTLFMSHIRQKEYAEALESAKRIEQANLDKSMGSNLIAIAYLTSGEKDKAKNKLENTLSQFPADELTSHNLARLHLQNNEFAEARKLYLAVLDKTPAHLQSLNQLAFISAKEGNKTEMIQWLKKAVELNPEKTAPKLLLGTQYLSQKNAKEAIQVLNDVDVKDREQVGYLALMSRAKLGVNQVDHAFRLLKKLISLEPNSAIGHFLMAQVYASQQKAERMRESLEKTVELSPDNLSAHLILARLDFAEGNSETVEKRIKLLDRQFPGNEDVAIFKAKKDSSEQNYDSAIITLSELMEAAPNTEVIVNLANTQWQSGDRQGAISSLKLWVQQNSSDYRVMLMLANFYLLDNRYDEATATYEQLEKELPESPTVLNNLAWSMKDTSPKKGLEFAQKANKIDPKSPYILDTLAMLHLINGDNTKALEISAQAAEKAPNVFDIQINYAEVLVANNNHQKATAILQTLLEKNVSVDQKKIVEAQLKLLQK